MKPVSFEEVNLTLTKPEGLTDEECGSLPICQTDDGRCVSCWELDAEERAKLLTTGRVYLSVWSGETQPPVCLTVDNPVAVRTCRVCGCTDANCQQCIEKTGEPCHWVAEDLCSACVEETEKIGDRRTRKGEL